MSDFLKERGYYKSLRVYKIAEIIYDITFTFCNKFLKKGDRTVDQMVQAARSGKQNIAEGSVAGRTSKETEIKLTNVARASMQELLLDYEDYLRSRRFEQWEKDSEKAIKTRIICTKHNDTEFYRTQLANRNSENVANIAIVLIHQFDFLICRLIERQKNDFIKNGGIKEEMYRKRMEVRNSQK